MNLRLGLNCSVVQQFDASEQEHKLEPALPLRRGVGAPGGRAKHASESSEASLPSMTSPPGPQQQQWLPPSAAAQEESQEDSMMSMFRAAKAEEKLQQDTAMENAMHVIESVAKGEDCLVALPTRERLKEERLATQPYKASRGQCTMLLNAVNGGVCWFYLGCYLSGYDA